MTNGQDRRRTDTQAARRRRHELQQGWEQSHASHGHLSERFAQTLGALVDISRRLPLCDRSAKLIAALTRLAEAADKPAAYAAARALLAASELALAEDPWFRFYRTANEA